MPMKVAVLFNSFMIPLRVRCPLPLRRPRPRRASRRRRAGREPQKRFILHPASPPDERLSSRRSYWFPAAARASMTRWPRTRLVTIDLPSVGYFIAVIFVARRDRCPSSGPAAAAGAKRAAGVATQPSETGDRSRIPF